MADIWDQLAGDKGLDRRIRIAFVLLLLILIGAAIAVFSHDVGIADERARIHAHKYETDMPARIAKNCNAFAGQKLQTCIAKEIKRTREDRRAEYDLSAQNTMARWTRYMGIFAGIAVVLSSIGIALIFVTLRETRKAAFAATQTHQAFVAVEEAHLVLSIDAPSHAERIYGHVDVTATNIGKTSCVITYNQFVWRGPSKFGIDQSIDYLSSSPLIIEGSSSQQLDKLLIGALPHQEIFLQGVVEYETAFGTSHRMYVCYNIKALVLNNQTGVSNYICIDSKTSDWPDDT